MTFMQLHPLSFFLFFFLGGGGGGGAWGGGEVEPNSEGFFIWIFFLYWGTIWHLVLDNAKSWIPSENSHVSGNAPIMGQAPETGQVYFSTCLHAQYSVRFLWKI